MIDESRLVLRWAARLLSLLPLFFVLAHLASEGAPDLSGASATEWALFGCLLGALIGIVALWRWELFGGLISVLSTTAFFAIHVANVGKLPGGEALPALFAPGLLAILAWSLKPKDPGAKLAVHR